MGAKSDGRVIHEVFERGKDGQLWKKGATDAEGYFTLVNHGYPKVLTAISESGLTIKGNIILRFILHTSLIFFDNLQCCCFTHRS